MQKFTHRLAITAAFALALALLSGGPRLVSAQDDQTTDAPGSLYAVALHTGTCESPSAEPAFMLGEARTWGLSEEGGDEEAEENFRGVENVVGVLSVDETIDVTFGDLFDNEPHVLVVHPSQEEMGTVLACGPLGGIEDDGRIVIGIASMSDDGVTGMAILDEDTSGILGLGDDEVNVRVYLLAKPAAETEGVDEGLTGMATPADDGEGGILDEAEATVEAGLEDAEEAAGDAAETVEDAVEEGVDEAEEAVDEAEDEV